MATYRFHIGHIFCNSAFHTFPLTAHDRLQAQYTLLICWFACALFTLSCEFVLISVLPPEDCSLLIRFDPYCISCFVHDQLVYLALALFAQCESFCGFVSHIY